MSTVTCIMKEKGKVVSKQLDYDSTTHKFITLLTPDMFLTEDEIVNDLFLNRLNQEDIDYLSKMKKDDVIMLHHGFGTSIRNQYGLWFEENPYTVLNDVMADNFPDQVSHRILEKMWEGIQPKSLYNAYDKAKRDLT